jgi:RNA polymerase sigma factor (sigma-70 family)
MVTTDWEKIKSALHRAIDNLPENLQEVINYYFYDEIPVEEIAKKFNRSTTYVYSNLRKAKYKLRRQLDSSYDKKAKERMAEFFNKFSL